MAVGVKGHLGMGKETTWGDAVAAAVYLPLVSESINSNIEHVVSAALRGVIDEPAPYPGMKSIAGDIVMEVYPASFGHVLRSALGPPDSDPAGTPVVLLDACNAAWDELVDGGVISTVDEGDYKYGSAAVKLLVTDDVAAGDLLATMDITATDMEADTDVKLWIKCSVGTAEGDLQFILGETAEGATPDKVLDIPVLVAGVWQEVTLDLGVMTGLTAIISYGLKYTVDIGECTILVDFIRRVGSTPATDAYTHVFEPRQDDFSTNCPLCPYTIEVYRDNSPSFRYKGAVVNTLNLSFGVGEKILKAVAGVLAKEYASVTPTSPDFEATNPFLWHQATVEIGGVQNNTLEAFSFTLDNKLINKPTLNGTLIPSMLYRNAARSVELTMEIDFTDQVQYGIFEDQTQQSITITLEGEEIETGHNYTLIIEIPKFLYSTYPVNIAGPGLIISNVAGKAIYDAVTGYTMKITLINEETSY